MKPKYVASLLLLLTILQTIVTIEEQNKSLQPFDNANTLLKEHTGTDDHNDLTPMSMNNPNDEGAIAVDARENARNDQSESELRKNGSPDETNQYLNPAEIYDDLDESERQIGGEDNGQYGMDSKDRPKNSPWGGRRRRRWFRARRFIRRATRVIRRTIRRVARNIRRTARRIARNIRRTARRIARNLRRVVRRVTRNIRRSIRHVTRKIRRVRLRRVFHRLQRVVRKILRRQKRPPGPRPRCDTQCQTLKKLRRYLKFFEQAHCAYTTVLRRHVDYFVYRNPDTTLLGILRSYKNAAWTMHKDLSITAKEMDGKMTSYSLSQLHRRCSNGASLSCRRRAGENAILRQLKCQPMCRGYILVSCRKKDQKLRRAITSASKVFKAKIKEIETFN